jgi:hypothetical protein
MTVDKWCGVLYLQHHSLFLVRISSSFTPGFRLAFSCVLFNWQIWLFLPHFLKNFGKVGPAPLLVLWDSVCPQALGNNDTFCGFSRTLIAACSRAAFLKLSIL